MSDNEEEDVQALTENCIKVMAIMCRECFDMGKLCAHLGAFLAENYSNDGIDGYMEFIKTLLAKGRKDKDGDPFKGLTDFETGLN